MKPLMKAFTVLLGIWIWTSVAHAQSAPDLLTQINNLKTSIEAQIERIKASRNSTDNQLSLARLRIGEQIRQSEEDLAIQMEQLQRLRDQLQDQKSQADQTVSRMQNDLSTISTTALSNIADQLSQTNDLLNRMRTTYEQVTGETDPTSPLTVAVTNPNLTTIQPSTSLPNTTQSDPAPTIAPMITLQPDTSQPDTTQSDPAPTTTPAVSPTPASGGG